MKYFIYCRRSQDRDDQQVLSIESQKRELLSFAKKHSLEIVQVISESMSAYKRGRPKFNWMMDRIEDGYADGILTWHLTRLSRNSADGGLIISFLDEGKIKKIRTIEKSYTNTADDKFIMTIHFAMAKKSSDDTSSFVKNNLVTKLENGEYPGQAPYGYLNIGANGVIAGKRFDQEKQRLLSQLNRPLKRIEQDPIDGPLVRKLFQLAMSGAYTLSMLQKAATEMGLKGKSSGKRLGKQFLLDLFSNVFFTGRFLYQGAIHKGCQEPLVSVTDFDSVQGILKSNSRPKQGRQEYPFSMLVKCPGCGGALSGTRNKGIPYYRCAKIQNHPEGCEFRSHIRQDELEMMFNQALQTMKIPKSIVSWSVSHLRKQFKEENKAFFKKNDQLQKRISQLYKQEDRLTEKWLTGEENLLTDREFKRQKMRIREEITHTETVLQDARGETQNWFTRCEEFFVRIRDLHVTFAEADLTTKRQLLQLIGAKFSIKGKKPVLKLNKPFSILTSSLINKGVLEPCKTRSGTHSKVALCNISDGWLAKLDVIRTFFMSNEVRFCLIFGPFKSQQP